MDRNSVAALLTYLNLCDQIVPVPPAMVGARNMAMQQLQMIANGSVTCKLDPVVPPVPASPPQD